MKFLDKILGIPEGGYGVAPVSAIYSLSKQQSTAEIVEQIHKEFNTAGDKLLAEAKAVIANTDPVSFKKADDLIGLGFGNAVGVADARAKQRELREKLTLQQLLVDYSVKYPTYCFIDDAGIETICKKYNLVFGTASQYTGFVPLKNLQEIKNFPGVKKEDHVLQLRSSYHGTQVSAWETVSEEQFLDIRQHYRMYRSYETRTSKDLLICAPLKDMKIAANQEVKGHQIVNIHYPDPVVMVPVRGGLYLIITAWGDESSDPLVVKEGLN